MDIQAHCIEGTSRVDPFGWSNHPFIAESKNLAANNEVGPAFRGTAEPKIRLANVPVCLIRRCIGNVAIEKDAGVLRLAEEAEPFHGLNRHIEPETAQEICIFR